MKISKLIIAICLFIIMTLPTLSGSLPFKEIEYSYVSRDISKSAISNLDYKCTYKHRIIFRKNKLYSSQFQQRCDEGTYNHSKDEGIVYRLGKSYRSKFTCKTAKNANYRNCSNGTRTKAGSSSSSRSSFDEKYTAKWAGNALQLDFTQAQKLTIYQPGHLTIHHRGTLKQKIKIAFKNGKCAVTRHEKYETGSFKLGSGKSIKDRSSTKMTKPVYCKIRR